MDFRWPWEPQRPSPEERLEAAKATIERSPTGEELTKLCTNLDVKFKTESRHHRSLKGSNGTYNPETNTITVAKNLPEDRLISTLAHELEHVRQIADGKYLDPRTISLDKCKENRCENEAKAESKANQVLVELAQRDIKAPLAAKLEHRDSAQEQCQVYALNRRFGADHETAARESEPFWGKNGIREFYEAEAAEEWKAQNRATRRDDAKAPGSSAGMKTQPAVSKPPSPQSTSREAAPPSASGDSKPVPAWKAKWADHVQKTKLPDPPPRPPDSQTRSRGRGR